ncbi:MAG: hypothetical protein IJA17_07780 [Oscillospiraceae bacterium]|nr:hypothetical protein [Oscillospiraceae bacterium]
MAKPKPPPFRQGGLFVKKRADNIRPYGICDDFRKFNMGGLLEKMHKKKGFFAPFALFYKGRKGGFYHFCPVGEIKNDEIDKNP